MMVLKGELDNDPVKYFIRGEKRDNASAPAPNTYISFWFGLLELELKQAEVEKIKQFDKQDDE